MLPSHIRLYYSIKKLIPRRSQLTLRRKLISILSRKSTDVWPVCEKAASAPDGWPGWPDDKKFALVLTHDVDTQRGHDNCLKIVEMEEKLGFRSSFNFVVDDYPVSFELRQELVKRGFEVGVHGLTHDPSLYKSITEFKKQARRINQILDEWNAVGFRSPSMYHNLEWLTFLDIAYDASTFDTDPFEPIPNGAETIFPFAVHSNNGRKGYIELPYTLAQDFTLFILMNQTDISFWTRKLDWIASHGGMALINVHPDYLNCLADKAAETYPAIYYQQFLEYILQQYDGLFWHVLPRDMANFWKSIY